jgi:hypothetical protein
MQCGEAVLVVLLQQAFLQADEQGIAWQYYTHV